MLSSGRFNKHRHQLAAHRNTALSPIDSTTARPHCSLLLHCLLAAPTTLPIASTMNDQELKKASDNTHCTVPEEFAGAPATSPLSLPASSARSLTPRCAVSSLWCACRANKHLPGSLPLEHVSPVTRLLEKRKQMLQVQESLDSQKVRVNRLNKRRHPTERDGREHERPTAGQQRADDTFQTNLCATMLLRSRTEPLRAATPRRHANRSAERGRADGDTVFLHSTPTRLIRLPVFLCCTLLLTLLCSVARMSMVAKRSCSSDARRICARRISSCKKHSCCSTRQDKQAQRGESEGEREKESKRWVGVRRSKFTHLKCEPLLCVDILHRRS